jgi:hypothetical protein
LHHLSPFIQLCCHRPTLVNKGSAHEHITLQISPKLHSLMFKIKGEVWLLYLN